MTASSELTFQRTDHAPLKHVRLKGLQPKTIEADSWAIGRIGAYFDHPIADLSEQPLTDEFTDLLDSPYLERGQARPVGPEILLHAWAAQALGERGSDHAAKGPTLARYPHRRGGATLIAEPAPPQRSGLLLHGLQPGLAPR